MIKRTFVLIMLVWPGVLLAGNWTLTTADFTQAQGELVSLNEQGVQLRQANVQTVDLADFVALRQESIARETSAFLLATRDGQRLAGKPVALRDEKVSWSSELVGETQWALADVKLIARAGTEIPAAGNEDVVILQNGDVLKGIVDGEEGGLVIQRGTDKTSVKWDAIRCLVLAQVGEGKSAAPAIEVRLGDASVLLADSAKLDRGALWLRRSNAEVRLPLDSVERIEHLAGRVRMLSRMSPATLQYTPYIASDTPTNGLSVLELAQVGAVMQLRPRTSATYIAPADGTVHFRFSCGDAGSLTDMSLTVTIAETVALKQTAIRSSDVSKAHDFPVAKGQSVAFLVDYGENFDVQDKLRLIDAAFVAK